MLGDVTCPASAEAQELSNSLSSEAVEASICCCAVPRNTVTRSVTIARCRCRTSTRSSTLRWGDERFGRWGGVVMERTF